MSNRPTSSPGSSAGRSGSGSKTPVWVWAAVAAVVVVALGIALLLTNSSNSNDLTIGEVTASGSALPPFTGQGPDDGVGRQAPVVRGTNFASEPVTIGEPGTPQVLVFLAHWCPVCQREVPEIVAWANAGGDTQGVEVVGVATSIDRTRGNWPPGAWLRSDGWPYQTLVDDGGNLAGQAFGLTSFPYFVVLDSSGKVVERVSGEVGQAAFAALVDAARSGTPSSPVTGGDSTPVGGLPGGDATATTGAPPAG